MKADGEAGYVKRLEAALSAIAHCDDPDHPAFEGHGLFRSHMILLAKNALES